MQFCQIVRVTNKKGGMGLTDFFSVLAFALILIVFYLLFKFTIGGTTSGLLAKSSNIENSISLLNLLRTPVIVDKVDSNIAGLIALSKYDSTKKDFMEKTLLQLLDESFGTSMCTIICIDGGQLKGKGCGSFLQTYECPDNIINIPSYNGKPIEISFEADALPLTP